MSRIIFHPHAAPKKLREAAKIVVSFSYPSKLPCPSYNLPARACITGAILAKQPGTICSGCYALHGFDGLPNQEEIQYKRLAAIKTYGIKWAHAMADIINYYNLAYFRWHASGDIQSVNHLFLINEIAWKTPNTKYWLATREWGMVRKFIQDYKQTIAPNLKPGIVLSATKFDQGPPIALAKDLGVRASGVSSLGNHTCMASENPIEVRNGRHTQTFGHCGSCRNCWEGEQVVIYKRH